MLQKKKYILGEGSFGTVAIGPLTNIGEDVAIKKGKGCSLIVEGRVYQALSGQNNFLHFFGVRDNCIVIEHVQVYDPTKTCLISNTLHHTLYIRVDTCRYNWIQIASGVIQDTIKMHEMVILHNDLKENNILLKESVDVIPKIFDFGEGHLCFAPEEKKKLYNLKHHLAYELRNLNC